jgi:hypothetical protein
MSQVSDAMTALTLEELDELQRLEDADCLDLIAWRGCSGEERDYQGALIRLLAAARVHLAAQAWLEIERLRAALKPFADKADQVTCEAWRSRFDEIWPVHVKHLRAAREAYYASEGQNARMEQTELSESDSLGERLVAGKGGRGVSVGAARVDTKHDPVGNPVAAAPNTNGEKDADRAISDGELGAGPGGVSAGPGDRDIPIAAPAITEGEEDAAEFYERQREELLMDPPLPEPIAAGLWRNAEDQVLELAKVLQTIAEEPVNWNATDHHYYAGIVGRFQLLADGVLKASPPIAAGEEDVVVPFTGITKLDLPAERIIGGAAKANLDAVVIIGFDGDGDFFFSANKADGGEVLWLMELARKKLMEIGDQ